MNGNLKSLHLLWVNLAQNHRYQPFVHLRDISEFTQRLENEGMTFLTSTLPNIGKALDEFHATMVWNPPKNFKTSKETNLPIFMGKAIKMALAGHSLAVDCVRQLTLIFYKLEVNYDPKTVEDFLVGFKKVDFGLSSFDFGAASSAAPLIKMMRSLIRRVLCNLNPHDLRPYHGSGSTACRTANYEKWHKLRYYPRLDATFSYSEHFFYSPTHLIDEYEKLEMSEELTPCARIVLVPKDSRGPRVISCEPAEHMYIQQGLMRLLYDHLETHPLTSGFVNFTNQKINRDLAQHASLHNDLATLDLSEASDRVSWNLVQEIFPPIWVDALEACRTPRTLLPDGTVVELNKFAPMGSSCCFPVEALVFWACASASIHMDWKPVKRVPVFVYGDDIIIESIYTDSVIKGLESVGLMVNRNKSYSSGPFRESCGGDYHNGVDVTPVRVRKFLSSVGTGIATSADLANSFIAKFGEKDAYLTVSVIEEAIGYVFPRSELPIPGCILTSFRASNDVLFRRRFNKHLQRFEHQIQVFKARVLSRCLPTWCELLRKELSRGRQRDSYSRDEAFRHILHDDGGELLPGEYADPYSAQKVWKWVWLGLPNSSSASFYTKNRGT